MSTTQREKTLQQTLDLAFDQSLLDQLYTTVESKQRSLFVQKNQLIEELIVQCYADKSQLPTLLKYGVEFDSYAENAINSEYYLQLLRSGVCTPQEFIEAFDILVSRNLVSFNALYSNARMFELAEQFNIFDDSMFECAFNSLLKHTNNSLQDRFSALVRNTQLCHYALKNNLIEFESLFNKAFYTQLVSAIRHPKLMKKLLTSNVVSTAQLTKFFELLKIQQDFDLIRALTSNTFLLKQLIDNNITTLKELFDLSCVSNSLNAAKLLANKEFMIECLDEGLFTKEFAQYAFDKFVDSFKSSSKNDRGRLLSEIFKNNPEFVEYLLTQNCIKFHELIKISRRSISVFLAQETCVESLLRKKLITDNDLYALFNCFHFEYSDLLNLAKNSSLLKYYVNSSCSAKEDLLNSKDFMFLITRNEKLFDDFSKSKSTFSNFDQKLKNYLNSIEIDNYISLDLLFSNIKLFQYLIDKNLYIGNIFDVFKKYAEDRALIFSSNSGRILKYAFEISKNCTHDFSWLQKLSESSQQSTRILKDISLDDRSFGLYVEKSLADGHNALCEKRHGFQIQTHLVELSPLLTELKAYEKFSNFVNLSHVQKLEIYELAEKNSTLHQVQHILDANLEKEYDFESLKIHLGKPDKKNQLSI